MTEETKLGIITLLTLGAIWLCLSLTGALQPSTFTTNIPTNQPQRAYH